MVKDSTRAVDLTLAGHSLFLARAAQEKLFCYTWIIIFIYFGTIVTLYRLHSVIIHHWWYFRYVKHTLVNKTFWNPFSVFWSILLLLLLFITRNISGGNQVKHNKTYKKDKIFIAFIYFLYTLIVSKIILPRRITNILQWFSPETGHGMAVAIFYLLSASGYCIFVICQKKLSTHRMTLWLYLNLGMSDFATAALIRWIEGTQIIVSILVMSHQMAYWLLGVRH